MLNMLVYYWCIPERSISICDSQHKGTQTRGMTVLTPEYIFLVTISSDTLHIFILLAMYVFVYEAINYEHYRIY